MLLSCAASAQFFSNGIDPAWMRATAKAGDPAGVPLLCQHTAGADGRQWRHVLEDAELQRTYRLISYDLPYHGRSLPPTEVEWWKATYKLTRAFFMAVPRALAAALGLHRPVFMGSSIGGIRRGRCCHYASSCSVQCREYLRITQRARAE